MAKGVKRKQPRVEVPRQGSSRPWLFAVAIVVAVFVVYGGGLDHPFMFDDMGAVVANPQIRSLDPAVALAPPPETPVGGRPLVNASFALNYAAGGLDPTGYRLVNVALHAACALLVFGLAAGLVEHARRYDIALAVALLWAVHPLGSEAVNYLTQRTELMMAACYLFTLYAAGRIGRGGRDGAWTVAAIAACAAGMACKESMVSAPLMVIVVDRVYRFSSFSEAFARRKGLYLGLVAGWGVLAAMMWTVPRTSAAGFASTHVSTWTYLLNQTEIITHYLRLAAWPDALVLYYGWATPTTLAAVWPNAVLIVALLIGAIALFLRRPRLGFLALWVFITLAPTSSFVPIASEVGAERRMYLPLIGLVGLLVVSAGAALERRRVSRAAIMGVAVALVLALGYRTVVRTVEYATPLGMAQTVLDRWPTPSAHYMVGTELVSAGRVAESVTHLRQAAAEIPPARFNLGSALLTTGQRDQGIVELETFLREEPGLTTARDARLLLARGHAEAGRTSESITYAQQVLQAAPGDYAAHGLLAEAFVATGRFDEAIPHYEAYLRSQQDDGAGWTGMGIALMSAGRPTDGVDAFGRAVASSPNHAGYRMNLARALIDSGQPAAAIEHARAAVSLTQGDPAALDLLKRAGG